MHVNIPDSPAVPPVIKSPPQTITDSHVFKTWWPLAASWLLMGTELPAVSAVIARLPDPEINLAAYGGVVFALALIIEAPIIMLLGASTALTRDLDAYRKLWRFMMAAGASLTAVHIMIAFTPLYDVVVGDWIGAPAEIIEPARIGLQIMTPWTWAIAYRRFNQGVMIRYGHSQAVGLGTALRLVVNFSLLLGAAVLTTFPGIVVGTLAVIAGVLSESLYAMVRIRPVLRQEVPEIDTETEPLSLAGILNFYIPLAMTSLLFLLVQPMGSAALSRMPSALLSLAVWPVISGLTFMIRSLGVAYTEVVVALLDWPGSSKNLSRFAGRLALAVTLILLTVNATPLASIWFKAISGLPENLSTLARRALWLALLWPAANVFQSWYQGTLMHNRKTRAITEAVGVFLISASLVLGVGVWWGKTPGLYFGMAAFVTGSLAQVGWLGYRSRSARSALALRDRPGD